MTIISRLLLLLAVCHCCSAVDLSRALDIWNESGHKLRVYWLRPETGEAVRFKDVESGAKFVINSFVNHTFMVRDETSECQAHEENCHVNYITVSDENDRQREFIVCNECKVFLFLHLFLISHPTILPFTSPCYIVVHIKEGLQVEYEGDGEDVLKDSSAGKKVVNDCKATAAARLASPAVNATKVFHDMATCVESGLARLLETKNNELAIEEKDRRELADKLENYTCADDSLSTSPPLEIRQWQHNGTVRNVHVLHERRASQIHVLQDFISEEECAAIEKAAEPKLHRGTVADGAGGHKLSEHRKAFQAGLKIPWDKEEEGDLIARYVRRVYDYTNHATGYNLSVVGQEDLMSIQYFGNGENDPTPDQYRPHCDGDCDGKIHKEGGRVATLVAYCTVPDKGGFTNFGQAGVTARPRKGAAAFFSYMDPETKIKDNGFTTHSGCPVVEGTKRIAVQWMRLGVDAENPWDSFNTLTIKKADAEDC